MQKVELTSLQTQVRTPGLNFEMPPLSSLRNWGRQVQRDWPSCLLKGEMCALPPTQLLSRCPARTSFLSAPVSYTGLSTATRGQSLLTERCCGSSKDNCPNWILFFCFKYLNKTKQYKRSQITYSGHSEDSQPFWHCIKHVHVAVLWREWRVLPLFSGLMDSALVPAAFRVQATASAQAVFSRRACFCHCDSGRTPLELLGCLSRGEHIWFLMTGLLLV